MSELEIKRRQEYKRNRKKWIIIQLVAIILFAAISLGSFIGYNQMNRTHYIEYNESGNIDYKVQYLENEFFEEEWIGKDQSYISSLINGMTADFEYTLNTDSEDMGFNYSYSIDAMLLIADKDSGTPFYTVKENILPSTLSSATAGKPVKIRETVAIDYVKFNELAKSFVDTYGLQNTSCTLIVTLNVDILCSNTHFEQETTNTYSTALNIPMVDETFRIHRTSAAPEGEVKVLEYKSVADRDFFYISSLVALALAVIGTVVLLVGTAQFWRQQPAVASRSSYAVFSCSLPQS